MMVNRDCGPRVCQATGAGRAEDRIAFKIAEPDSLSDDFGTIGNAGAFTGSRFFGG